MLIKINILHCQTGLNCLGTNINNLSATLPVTFSVTKRARSCFYRNYTTLFALVINSIISLRAEVLSYMIIFMFFLTNFNYINIIVYCNTGLRLGLKSAMNIE